MWCDAGIEPGSKGSKSNLLITNLVVSFFFIIVPYVKLLSSLKLRTGYCWILTTNVSLFCRVCYSSYWQCFTAFCCYLWRLQWREGRCSGNYFTWTSVKKTYWECYRNDIYIKSNASPRLDKTLPENMNTFIIQMLIYTKCYPFTCFLNFFFVLWMRLNDFQCIGSQPLGTQTVLVIISRKRISLR